MNRFGLVPPTMPMGSTEYGGVGIQQRMLRDITNAAMERGDSIHAIGMCSGTGGCPPKYSQAVQPSAVIQCPSSVCFAFGIRNPCESRRAKISAIHSANSGE